MTNLEHADFHRAAFFAWCGADADDIEIDTMIAEVVETHEPVESFRPLDVMSGKLAGTETVTPHGTVIVRKGVQRAKGEARRTMFIGRDETSDMTLIGWSV